MGCATATGSRSVPAVAEPYSRRRSTTRFARAWFAPMHWADAFAPDVAINAVTNDAVDADSLQPEFKVCAVAVTAIETEASPAELTRS